MTRDPIDLGTLIEARVAMRRDLLRGLTDSHKRFLLGLSRARPDWSLLSSPNVSELPALRWKLANLQRFRKQRSGELEQQAKALEDGLAL